MTDLRKAAEMALTALDALYVNDYSGYEISKHESHIVDDAIQALRQALAQPSDSVEHEPVVWDVFNGICLHSSHSTETKAKAVAAEMQKRHSLSGSLAAFNVKPRTIIQPALAESANSTTDFVEPKALAQPEQEPLGGEWVPCVKLPIIVHVRNQRDGETHISTREGITPVLPEDLIMRGVAGEEYPIGRELFERTYTFDVDAVNTSQERVDETAKGEHEPVGYIDGMYGGYMVFTPLNQSAVYLNGTALYFAPPKREWVGLTDDELPEGATYEFDRGVRWAEAKLKEKNT